jgi:predicted solute-binding protein
LQPTRPRVAAVSYLNTVPLVWGFAHSPELRDVFDVNFALPSLCAQQMSAGQADIGILPVIEMARQQLDYFPGTGIACHGPVRTILLISKVPYAQIKTLAVDAGSRTSVMLSRVILAERFGATPTVFAHPADMEGMLAQADAALIIGDPALHIDPATIPYHCLDLGGEWVTMTGLPMVFAVWSARKELIQDRYAEAFRASCRYGLDHMDDIVREQSPLRGVSPELTRAYLTKHIVFELGDEDYEGMRRYLDLALSLDRATISKV